MISVLLPNELRKKKKINPFSKLGELWNYGQEKIFGLAILAAAEIVVVLFKVFTPSYAVTTNTLCT